MVDQTQRAAGLNLVAIDVAKDWNVVLVQEATGARHTFKVANRRPDHDRFIAYLKALPGCVRAAFEPTGDYHRPLAYRLMAEGLEVRSVSSVALARLREARYGTWDKNDPKDAQVILYMLSQGMVQTYHDPLINGTNDIQELANTYFQVSLARTRLQHSLLLHYIPLYFPQPAIEMFRIQLARYADLNDRRDKLDRRAQELMAGNIDYERLQTLPGVGPVMALAILAEAGDLRRFGDHRQFLKYCGFDLAKSQSGQSRGREELSKRGNKRLRMVCWLAAVRAIHMRENAFRDKYERYMTAMPLDPDRKRKALTAVAAKMARVIYAIVITGTDYERFFEQRLPSGSIPLTRAVEANATS